MAEAAIAGEAPEKKKKKPAAAGAPPAKVKDKGAKKADKGNKTKKAKKPKKASRKETNGGLEALARIIDHPLVADLLAAGAVAAVAAIAEHQLGSKKQSSSKLVKSAGQAAASAIGRKLKDEFGAISDAATDAAKKSSRAAK